MKLTSILTIAASFCLAIASIGCGSPANTAANTGTNINKSNTAVVTNTTANSAANSANHTANTEVSKSEAAADSVGVPECDEYIKKYEACLTTIAPKAPQAQGALKSSFEAQRNGFKAAAATPQGKATLASTCKQAIETAKTSTATWCTNW